MAFGMALKAAKEGFFDSAKVMAATDAATRKNLSKFGAFLRQRAKTSIKKRKRVSLPGQPPSSHRGTLKNLIFFSYDTAARSVVTGPVLSDRPTGAPETLEYSGKTMIRRHGKAKRVSIAARPFMQPAFEQERGQLPSIWKDSVR